MLLEGDEVAHGRDGQRRLKDVEFVEVDGPVGRDLRCVRVEGVKGVTVGDEEVDHSLVVHPPETSGAVDVGGNDTHYLSPIR